MDGVLHSQKHITSATNHVFRYFTSMQLSSSPLPRPWVTIWHHRTLTSLLHHCVYWCLGEAGSSSMYISENRCSLAPHSYWFHTKDCFFHRDLRKETKESITDPCSALPVGPQHCIKITCALPNAPHHCYPSKAPLCFVLIHFHKLHSQQINSLPVHICLSAHFSLCFPHLLSPISHIICSITLMLHPSIFSDTYNLLMGGALWILLRQEALGEEDQVYLLTKLEGFPLHFPCPFTDQKEPNGHL